MAIRIPSDMMSDVADPPTGSFSPDFTEAAPTRADIVRWDGAAARAVEDELAAEEPLEIRVRGRAISTTMRTPGHDTELAAGFLLTEGVVQRAADLLKIEPCGRNESGNVLNVLLAPEVHVDFDRLTRHLFTGSSCGLCGKATIDAVCGQASPLRSQASIAAETLARLPEIMRRAQPTFDRTGGLHAAALFDTAGDLIVAREDVGRHNAVDKVIGHMLLKDAAPPDEHVLLVSGRVSFEIVQKALAGRIAIVAAVSAPSSLAVAFARQAGQTLIGFLRDQRMNVYSHPSRVRFSTSSQLETRR